MTVRFAVNSEVPVEFMSGVDVYSRDAEVWVWGRSKRARPPGCARAAGVAVAARPAGRLPPSGQRRGATSHRPLGSAGWQLGASGALARIERRPNDGEGERRTTCPPHHNVGCRRPADLKRRAADCVATEGRSGQQRQPKAIALSRPTVRAFLRPTSRARSVSLGDAPEAFETLEGGLGRVAATASSGQPGRWRPVRVDIWGESVW